MRYFSFLILFTLSAFSPKILLAQYGIIPKPALEHFTEGYFIPGNNFNLECLSNDSAFRSMVQTWVKDEYLKNVAPNKTVLTKISIQLAGILKWNKYLKKLKLNHQFEPGTEGYVIAVEKNNILLLAQTETGLFYGFQTIKQLFKLPQIPCGEIDDKPSFPVRAWQDDISRGPIPTMDQLKKEIRTLANYKLNYFTLYTEHVFKYKSHPDIAPGDGISAEEITELTNYAKAYHIELIANQQSFGHMEKILAKPAYSYLGESKHILSPAQEGTYQLLGNFYKELNECYNGQYFLINADETFGLGTGLSKAMADSMGIGNLYAYHINRVYNLLKPYGKKMMMWSDIIADYPEIKNKIPKDIILIPWAYHDATDFTAMLEPIVNSGFDFWVAPGINNWQNLYPNIKVAQKNIYNLLRDGFAGGAKGVLNTSWDDDGYDLFNNNWQGLVWGADLSWNAPQKGSVSDERWTRFKPAFDHQFWGAELAGLQEEFAAFHQSKLKTILHNQTFFEPVFPMYPEYLGKETENNNLNLLAQSKILYKKADSLLNKIEYENNAGVNLKYAIREAQFTLEKNIFRIHYNEFLQSNYSRELLLSELNNLTVKLKNLKEDFKYLYLQECRNWWLSENLQKFDKLLSHFEELPYHCIIIPDPGITKKGRKYTLQAPLSEEPVYYSIGKNVTAAGSKKYTKPFYSKKDIQINCAVLSAGSFHSVATDSFLYHQAIGTINKINLSYSKYHPSYSGGGPLALADGKTGVPEYLRSGRWQGYSGNDLIIDMSFVKPITMNEFQMGFYQCTPSWVILPKELQLYISEDGRNYSLLDTLTHNIPVDINDKLKFDFKKQFSKQKISYLRVVCKYFGPLPPSHSSAGSPSMIFSDEIIIR